MENIVRVKNLKKSYKDVKAVNDISFDVKKGSLFAFLGENGAGKSTTINVLCSVLIKDSGTIIIDGHDIDTERDIIKPIIGIVFQGTVLDNELTVKENLISRGSYYGYSKSYILSKIDELSKLLELDEILDRKYKNLSGGQRRRVDIARALINDPKLLILDEPTTGLDPKTRQIVWEIINDLRIKKNLTVFLTTHYMEETKESDEIVIIDHGKIVASGTPNELKNKYSSNRFVWHIKQSEQAKKLLDDNNLSYEYVIDSYIVKFEDNQDIIDFIYKNKELVKDFEVIKGDMDDVFLNVTGRKMGD